MISPTDTAYPVLSASPSASELTDAYLRQIALKVLRQIILTAARQGIQIFSATTNSLPLGRLNGVGDSEKNANPL